MISQGASAINITFVIDQDQLPEVVRGLHDAFFRKIDPLILNEPIIPIRQEVTLKVALLGYGKMGKLVETIALREGWKSAQSLHQ